MKKNICTKIKTGLSFILIAQATFSQNKVQPWQYYINTKDYKHIPADTSQQILVWRTPKPDPTYLNAWLDSIRRHCGEFKITVFCGACDSSLMLLTGAGIRTYIQGTGGGKGGGGRRGRKQVPQNCLRMVDSKAKSA